jgi:hypothetical protein
LKLAVALKLTVAMYLVYADSGATGMMMPPGKSPPMLGVEESTHFTSTGPRVDESDAAAIEIPLLKWPPSS